MHDAIDRAPGNADNTGVCALTLIKGWSDRSATNLAHGSVSSTESIMRNWMPKRHRTSPAMKN